MAGIESNDTDNLLAPPPTVSRKRGSVSTQTRGDTYRRRLRAHCRCPPFLVEPVLILYFFSEFPVDIIGQKYVLDWIADHLRNGDHKSTSALQSVAFLVGASASCSPNGTSDEVAFQDRVQSLASWFAVIESAIWGVPAILSTIILGSMSDRLGRRSSVLPALIGVLASSSASFFVVWYKASIFWFFVSDVVYGLCGSFAAMTMSCFAYVADHTPPHRRMVRIVVVEMCMLLAGVVSPLGVGTVVDRIGYAYTLLVIVGSSTFNFAYVFIFLPDSDDDDDDDNEDSTASCTVSRMGDATFNVPESSTAQCDTTESSRSGNVNVEDVVHSDGETLRSTAAINEVDTLGSVNLSASDASHRLRSTTSGFLLDRPATLCGDVRRTAVTLLGTGERRWKIVLLLFAFFVLNLPLFNASVGTLFEMNHPLCWNINLVGIFTGASLGVSTVGGLIMAPLMKMCMPDIGIAICAGIASMVTNVYKAFVQTSLMMFISPALSMFTILMIPSIRSTLSSIVGDDEQGAVFGAIASIEVTCYVLGTVIFNSIYSSTLDTLGFSTGFVFLAMAAFYAVGCFMLIVYAIKTRCSSIRKSHDVEATVERLTA